ncbi:MAG TPA: phage terminase large subunit [Candidatus Kapabacteria bacterium]|nr:phage terminase large subunit [Candidatus Kapabacteria bacterium]
MQINYKEIKELIQNLAVLTPGFTALSLENNYFEYPPHLRYLDKIIAREIVSGGARLIINMPPRHGKSELISKYLPFWFLGTFPDKRIILCSYEKSFAVSLGRKVRDLINLYGKKIFDIELRSDSRAVADFNILHHRGGMSVAGAGGSITGKGADLLIIDDPIKNDAIANSSVMRDNIWEWFLATVYTRIEPNGNIIIVMTRWHQDDITGRILENIDTGNWKLIKLPALANGQDILERDYDEPLWEDRFSKKQLLDIKNTLGTYWFTALYQQEPSIKNGSIFKRSNFKYFYEEGEFYYLEDINSTKFVHKSDLSIYITVDLAISSSQMADYTVALVAGRSRSGEILILDVIRQKIGTSEHLSFLQKIYLQYKPVIIGIEAVQYQVSLIEIASKLGLPVSSLKADKDKISRSLAIAAKIEQGIVYFKRNSAWRDDFEKELLEFPTSKHDDQVDALAYIERIISPISSVKPVGRRKI